jgi:hypothetical protein
VVVLLIKDSYGGQGEIHREIVGPECGLDSKGSKSE